MKKGKRSPKTLTEDGGSMNSLVRANIEVTQADLVTVAVSRAETHLQNQLEELKTRISAIESEKKSIQEQAEFMVNKHVKDLYSEQIERINKAVAAIGSDATVETDHSFCSKKAAFPLQAPNSTSFSSASHIKIIFRMCSAHDRHVLGSSFCLSDITIPIADVVIADVVRLSALQSRFNDLKSELETETQKTIGIRKKLSSIPTLERRFKAMLVENQLASTPAGRDLLASIGLDARHVTGTIEEAIKALPSA